MPELVPGYTYLGVGFDGFGSYDESASKGMLPLFDTATPGSNQWTNPATNIVYTLPVNVGEGPVEKREAQTVVFENRSEMSTFFRAEAGLKASYLSFSGSLSASYESISKSFSEYHYGMAYAYTEGYELSINEPTRDHLSHDVLDDPDFAQLPDQYNSDTQAAFFRLFKKYGTHFVSAVRMGGRIYYESWIEKSFNMNQAAVEAALNLEYKAVMISGSAEAKVEWNQLSKVWTNNRQTRIRALGGNEQVLDGLAKPSDGESYASQYSTWVNSVGGRPAPVGFSLAGIETLFSGNQSDAVQQASQDYSSRTLLVEGKQGFASIQVNGVPAFKASDKNIGVAYAIVDRSSLEVVQSGVYSGDNVYPDFYPPHETDPKISLYDHLASELSSFQGNTAVIVAMLFWDIVGTTGNILGYPTAALFEFLHGIGAGDGLAQWTQPTSSTSMTSYPTGTFHLSYGIVGIPGSPENSALEDMDCNYSLYTVPETNLEAFLRPEASSGEIIYTPS